MSIVSEVKEVIEKYDDKFNLDFSISESKIFIKESRGNQLANIEDFYKNQVLYNTSRDSRYL